MDACIKTNKRGDIHGMLETLVILLVYAASTLAFYYGVVCFGRSLLQRTENSQRRSHALLLSFINFIFFTLYGMLGLGLIFNWAAFLVVFYAECRYLFKVSRRSSVFISLCVCMCGLSAMLFSRAVFAIAMDLPLGFFDSAVGGVNNIKAYPVILGYIICFVLFRYCSAEKTVGPLRHLMKTRSQMRMLMVTMLLLMAHLMLQFFLYESTENNLVTKIWSMIACIYMSGGLFFSIKYAIRVGYLCELGSQNDRMQKILSEYKNEEQILRVAASKDTLTGLWLQAQGKNKLQQMTWKGLSFSLCVVDLDGLKYVNDTLGHASGDAYLVAVAEILKKNCRHAQDVVCRYGGDEFVLGFMNLSAQEAELRMAKIAEQVRQCAAQTQLPMEISYGIAQSKQYDSYEKMFAAADGAMYEMKKKHKQQNPAVVRL